MAELTVELPELHHGQERVVQSTARYRVVMCGRRWGKTTLGVSEACEALLNGQSVGWFAPLYRYALDPWREILRILRPVAMPDGVSEQEKRLALVTDGVLKLWTCDNPDPGRGDAYDLVIVDEAGLVRGFDAIWQNSIRPTLTDRQGRALFLGTPKGRTHDFSTLFAKATSGTVGWQGFRAPTSDNSTLPGLAAEIAAAKSEMPPQAFAQEYEGIPADDGGNPFGLDAIQACTMTAEEWALAQKAERIAWGWDFARAQDWTVGIALGRQYEVTGFERWQLVPWDKTYQDVVKATGRVPAWGDATAMGGDIVVETLQARGCPMQGYVFSRPSKQLLMQRLASTIQQRKVRFPAGVIVSELETFGYEYTAGGGVRYTAADGLHDDTVVALALAVYGRDQFGELPALVPAKTPSDDDHPGMDLPRGKRFRRPTGLPTEPANPSWIPDRGPTRQSWIPGRAPMVEPGDL